MRSFYLLSLLLLLAGCGSGPYQVAKVSGRVTLNGQPLAHAAVTFQPLATQGKTNPGPGSGGITDSDGRYTLTLIGTDTKGAVIGKHTVTISRVQEDDSADDRPQRSKRPPAKRKARQQFEFDVPPGGTNSAEFNLILP